MEPIKLTKTAALASIVNRNFDTAKTHRTDQENVWISAMRNFNGEYSPDIEFREGGSSVFINITQMKTMAAFSRIMAIMMGPSGYPWNIKPTPHPILVKMGLSEPAAEVTSELSPEFKQELSEARSAADGMRNRIKDNLIESFWEEKFSRGVLDLVSIGTMVCKGPVALPQKPKKWVKVESQTSILDRIKGALGMAKVQAETYQLMSDPMDEYRAVMEWVSPFEFYPDPSAYAIEDAMYAIHRHVMNMAQLVELISAPGFDPEEIKTVLENNPTGNWTQESWESSVDSINNRSQVGEKDNRFVVLEYWGYFSGADLREAGASIKDSELHVQHMANVWVCGGQAIKVALSGNQAKRIPFFVVPYEKVPYKIWGRGVPEKMEDPQSIINGSARAMVENMAMCVTGDTVVYRHQRPSAKRPRKYGNKALVEVTINHLWAQKNKKQGGLRQNVIRSLNELTGEFYGNRVKDVFYNGEKDVYRLTTKLGYTIKATDNHRFIGADGVWRELREFRVGDLITVNGTDTAPNGKCVDCEKPLSTKVALRCKSCASKVSTWNMKQANEAVANRSASTQTARQRKLVREQMKPACEECGATSKLQIHHLDIDPLNCAHENLKTLCSRCHYDWHAVHGSAGDPVLHTYRSHDEIISIEHVGVEKVYDLEMTAPDHNFVANGFVVHNCAGPQLIYDPSRIAPGTDIKQIIPWGITAIKTVEGVSTPPVQFVKIDPVINELKLIMDIFRGFVQEVTSMPDLASGFTGQGEHNRTMGGMSMLYGAADSYTRSVIFNIDNHLTKPMIRAMYDWEMQYCPDPTIKGDMTIEASGVQGLMAKELTSQRLAELLQAVGQIPGGADYINMPELMKEVFRSLEVINDCVVLSEPEVQAKRAQAQEASIQQAAAQAQATNLPKPKAETTRNDAMLTMLQDSEPGETIRPLLFEKTLAGYDELDPQSQAALNMMKDQAVSANRAFASEKEIEILSRDLELAQKLAPPEAAPAPQIPQMLEVPVE